MCTRKPRSKHLPTRLWMRAYCYNPRLFGLTFILAILTWVLWGLSLDWS